nr:hypothetical protein [Tetragenococcus osmophilus]
MKTKKVIISAPTKDEETKVVVFGVNQEILSPSDKIISAASCTTNGLALMTKILVDEFGIQRGLMSGSRAYTATQNMQDAPGDVKVVQVLKMLFLLRLALPTH